MAENWYLDTEYGGRNRCAEKMLVSVIVGVSYQRNTGG
jgi:hypothetical protein